VRDVEFHVFAAAAALLLQRSRADGARDCNGVSLRTMLVERLYVTRHTARVTRHTSHVTRHTPHVTRHQQRRSHWTPAAAVCTWNYVNTKQKNGIKFRVRVPHASHPLSLQTASTKVLQFHTHQGHQNELPCMLPLASRMRANRRPPRALVPCSAKP
jgi:hypothetical protein